MSGVIEIFDIWGMTLMKVLHLSSESSWRGGEQQIAYLIEESVSQGHDVIVAARKGSAFAKWCSTNNIHFHEFGFANGLDLFTAIGILRLVKNLSPDIVHVHSGKSVGISYLMVLFGLRVPLVVHRRVDFPLRKGGFSLRKYNHSGVKAIICVSEAIASLARERVDHPERVHKVFSGIDFSRFRSAPDGQQVRKEFKIPIDKTLIGNVSAVAPHKDYPTFLSTAANVLALRQDVHFLIVGDGALLELMKALAMEKGISEYVHFTGFRDDVPALLKEIDIFLITSETEGLGTTIIDAMYNSLPVVATRAGGIPELVIDGKTGFLCDIHDPNGLAQAINTIMDDPNLAATLGSNGHLRSLKFGKTDMANQILAIYREILKSTKF